MSRDTDTTLRLAVTGNGIELGFSWLRTLLEIGSPLDRSFDLRDERFALAGARLASELRRQDRDPALAIESVRWEILQAAMRRDPRPTRPSRADANVTRARIR